MSMFEAPVVKEGAVDLVSYFCETGRGRMGGKPACTYVGACVLHLFLVFKLFCCAKGLGRELTSVILLSLFFRPFFASPSATDRPHQQIELPARPPRMLKVCENSSSRGRDAVCVAL